MVHNRNLGRVGIPYGAQLGNIKDSNIMKFTQQQIANWRYYEEVRASGHYIMFDPRARLETGLNTGDYAFVMDNYSALRTQAIMPEFSEGDNE